MDAVQQAIIAEECGTFKQYSNDSIATCIDQLIHKALKDDSSTDFSSQGTTTPTETQSEDGDASVRSLWKFNALPATPHESLTVKHTFIHLEIDSEDDAVATLTKCQSLPSFPSSARGCTHSEAKEDNYSSFNPLVKQSDCQQFSAGDDVVIDGLLRFTDFNGRSGTVLSWNTETCRYDILLADGTGTIEERHVTVKPENLKLCSASCPVAVSSTDCLSIACCEEEEAGDMSTSVQSWPSTPSGDDITVETDTTLQSVSWVTQSAFVPTVEQSAFVPNVAPMWQGYDACSVGNAYWQPETLCTEADWWVGMPWCASEGCWQETATTMNLDGSVQMPFAR